MDSDSVLNLHTGRQLPVIGLGTWELTRDTAATVEQALRLGYRMIDTAVDYYTQPDIGEALRRSDVDQRDVYLITKVEETDDAYAGTERDLQELGLSQVDLMLIHRPPPGSAGVELWEGLLRARDDDLTADVGVSNYSIAQLDQLISATGETPVVNQIEWTPFGWSQQMLDYCRERHIVVQAYSPLTRARRLTDERLSRVAADYGKTPAQILIRWNLQRGVVPVPKANNWDHLGENIDVFDFEISEAHLAALDELDEQWSALGGSLQYV